jgi:sporulation protein YlmC with PRC-barrel domain
MNRKIQLQKDADVLNENGKEIGLLERVVLNPETGVVTDLVVRTGTFLDRKERVVSMDMVVEASEHLVILRDDKDVLDSLPPFEEKRLVSDVEKSDHSTSHVPPVVYGYPGGAPLNVPPTHDQKLVTWTVRNIPEGTVAMKEGAKVIAMGGKYVGNVESVLADPRADKVTHLQISSGRLLSKETKLIPIQWVKDVGEDEVLLKVKKDSIEEVEEIAALD